MVAAQCEQETAASQALAQIFLPSYLPDASDAKVEEEKV